jgi:hypothetical protein
MSLSPPVPFSLLMLLALMTTLIETCPNLILFDFKTVTIGTVHFVTAPDTVVDDTYKTALLTDTDGTVRGQIDIGSFASWTDQLDFLHDFVKYTTTCGWRL